MQPILMNFKSLNACVIGFGAVGRHKARQLYHEGAVVHVVDPGISEEAIAAYGQYHFIKASYTPEHLEHMDLVIAATSDRDVNQRIAKDAKARHLLCSISDDGQSGSFTWMSVVRRGPLTIGISTGHQFPGLTKKIRVELENKFPEDYGDYVAFMGKERAMLKSLSAEEKEAALEALLEITYDLYKQGRETSEH